MFRFSAGEPMGIVSITFRSYFISSITELFLILRLVRHAIIVIIGDQLRDVA